MAVALTAYLKIHPATKQKAQLQKVERSASLEIERYTHPHNKIESSCLYIYE